MEPLKSPADAKSYKYLKLPNGLSVLLIHDPAVAKALKTSSEESQQHEEEHADGGSSMTEGSDAGSDGSSSGDGDDNDDASGEDGSDEGSDGGRAARKQGNKPVASGSKKAAAAMAVSVGSFSDPLAMQGLSHYLEHMLFMGSSKFPDENDYDAFLTKNGGSSNAFTELEFTNYHFDVAPGALHGALDRFAQFFVAPLFQADSLEREVQAVDSEFAGVQQSDHSRLVQLMCHTSKAGHVYNKFSWGNKASLWEQPLATGLDVRQQIIDYYKREYGAERMGLALLGGQELDQMEAWVRELFEAVPRGVAGPSASFAAAGQPFEGRLLYVAPAVKEHHEVTVTFQLPCLRDEYTNKPDQYISHLVGHEGPGSLLSALKSRGWALELCAGVDDDGYNANTAVYLFTVSIVLTEAGLAAGPGFGLAPVALLFQFLRLLRQAGPQQWVWAELKAISDMKWRFVEEEDGLDLVTRLASSMGWVAPQHLLVAEYLHETWQPDKVLELMSAMDPVSSSYRIDLLTRSFPALKQQLLQPQDGSTNSSSSLLAAAAGSAQQFTEPWFKMDAVAVQLPPGLTASWAEDAISADLALPPPNPYIPSDFSLKAAAAAAAPEPRKKQQQQQGQAGAVLDGVESWMLLGGEDMRPSTLLSSPPKMLMDEPGLRLWHKLAVGYGQPRAATYFRLSGPADAASPAAAVLGALWLRLVEEALAEDSYLADVAGLHWSSSSDGPAGFEVRLDGFSHKLELLIGHVFEALATAKVKDGSFAAVHEQLLRRYRNAMLSPSKAAGALRLRCLAGGAHWSSDQLAEALQQVKGPEEVQAFAAEFLRCCHLEGLMMGNITAAEATCIARRLRHDILPAGGAAGEACLLPAADRPQQVCVRLPDGCEMLHKSPARNSEEENCCVEVYYQIGMASDLKLRVLADLADQLLFEPLYDALRTKQQLGYTVSSGARLTHGVSGFCVVVVSAAFSADEVEARIEAFLEDFLKTLQAMPQEEFERHKAALASNKLQQDTALSQEGERTWEQVSSCRYEFLCKEQEVALLQHVSLADVEEFYATYLSPQSAVRRKLCVQVVPLRAGGRPAPAAGAQAGNEEEQQQQHVQHDGPHQQHLVGTAVVRAGVHRPATAAAAAEAAAGLDEARSQHVPGAAQQQPPAAKRRKQQQEGSAGSTGGKAVCLVEDVDGVKAGLQRFPAYCTVQPVVSA